MFYPLLVILILLSELLYFLQLLYASPPTVKTRLSSALPSFPLTPLTPSLTPIPNP